LLRKIRFARVHSSTNFVKTNPKKPTCQPHVNATAAAASNRGGHWGRPLGAVWPAGRAHLQLIKAGLPPPRPPRRQWQVDGLCVNVRKGMLLVASVGISCCTSCRAGHRGRSTSGWCTSGSTWTRGPSSTSAAGRCALCDAMMDMGLWGESH
jgi:hypothetical protein